MRNLLFLVSLPLCLFLVLPSAHGANGQYNVVDDFGAVGDGSTDNTAAFTNAIQAASNDGGGIVTVPSGNFLIGPISILENVTLKGTWASPPRARSGGGASTLRTTSGSGNASGTPLITLQTSATLRDIAILYPNQTNVTSPVAYPWTIRGAGEGVAVINVNVVNPYQCLDLGTNPCDRHFVDGLYAQALYRGVYIDQSEGGTVQNIHLWPFFTIAGYKALNPYVTANAIAYQFGNVRGEKALNLFAIFYDVTFQFDDYGHGPGYGVYTNMYPDISPNAFDIQEVDPDKGIQITNGLIFSGVSVGPDNTGPVTFSASGFIGSNNQCANGFVTTYHANLQGTGHVTFNACHFNGWDEGSPSGVPCIVADCTSVTLTGNEFNDSRGDRLDVELGSNVEAAIVTANRGRNGFQLIDNTGASADKQIALNTGTNP